ncbi:hypothetical protein E5Q_04629 [Mixia osmundae IAM 14324]|uniref:DNA-(apurinic or apyrimidinic site) endonuclease n=1 Tax=Mixia osmundae (strain CBS 9802 / IAM 14324 / JCM 22182 / KY 12970) TaxID=764103 RepID=G7E539_MIXOS|nr:hypothetical protein E5Q_04629 [Mixia osmundae IAM 14324]
MSSTALPSLEAPGDKTPAASPAVKAKRKANDSASASEPVESSISKTKPKKSKKVEAEDELEDATSKPKKDKKVKEPVRPLDPSLPTNKTIPAGLSFETPARQPDAVRLTAVNLSGMAASLKKGMWTYLEAEDADVVIMTETKIASEPAHEGIQAKYKHRYFSAGAEKGQAGTAVLSKIEPLSVAYDLPTLAEPGKLAGRLVRLEFPSLYVLGTYTPNAGQGLKSMPRKQDWNEAFERYLRELDSVKPVVWMGDLNVAPTSIDVRNSKKNWDKEPGHTAIERDAFVQQLQPTESEHKPLIDVWRHRNPDVEQYTYYSYRFDCRTKGIGWRLDYAIVSERMLARVQACEIRQIAYGFSDHVCPISVP